jgi:hypothetical protein
MTHTANSATHALQGVIYCPDCHSTNIDIREDEHGNTFLRCEACPPKSTKEENTGIPIVFCWVCGTGYTGNIDDFVGCEICCMTICASCHDDTPHYTDPQTDEREYYCSIECARKACDKRPPPRLPGIDEADLA